MVRAILSPVSELKATVPCRNISHPRDQMKYCRNYRDSFKLDFLNIVHDDVRHGLVVVVVGVQRLVDALQVGRGGVES